MQGASGLWPRQGRLQARRTAQAPLVFVKITWLMCRCFHAHRPALSQQQLLPGRPALGLLGAAPTGGEGVERDLVLLALGAHLLAHLQAGDSQPGGWVGEWGHGECVGVGEGV